MKQTVYVASPESQQIHVWRLDGQGELSLLQVVDVGAQVQPMVVSPDKSWLYVGVRPDFRVIAYRIAPDDGTLSEAAHAALSGSPTHISTDHSGAFLFTASYNAGSVSVTPLENGRPQPVAFTVEGLEGCHSANISPDNETLWVPALKQDRICLFTLGDDGDLVLQDPAEVTTVEGAGPRHMTFHPNRQYGYCVNELNSTIDVWQLSNPHDEIECVQSLDMMPPDFSDTRWAADIHITPDGKFLYACDRTASIITIFSVSEDGSVLSVEGYQKTEAQPRGFNIDDAGKFLIAAGQKSHHIAVYEITGEQGLLVEKGRYAVGQGPMWVTINAF
ncbi:6-phosphogluconolactonase [Shimwellia blattae]|uniref:6-phosphogluconolactonase n=1 Tax=Shimwellia blattae (strain ATCC 29907 / DSM 4481 / JCM 1650 / NBRC 105725 / CDC 9005-74) TaxID=630626 RepID=I2BB07_SHIBC|nr:6-phosphogluconolactonase [Shimwellia blattae]AFJ47711.1 6-phosphogluconolactonase [Shimwellia blattae DSM 4481 = NBRC 105725]GAB79710.1 6-phosphogluconolactonase [Shimwellia blattae DSM 4481 = NBRC 105725]VDY65209.1 6-phosphogluconolactonase [Shimwellia blattae]VEC23905.1 6-phosphogluconolactonase [Shimwellia blattae]